MSDSLRPPWTVVHGILQAKILAWVAFLQGIFPTQESNRGLLDCIHTSDPSVSLAQEPLHTRAPLYRSLFHHLPPTPNHPQSEGTSHFLLFIQNNHFKYNLRTPPSTGVCLCFLALPPRPTPPHGHSLGVLGGQGNVGGLWCDQGTVLETRHNDGSLFPLGPKRQ